MKLLISNVPRIAAFAAGAAIVLAMAFSGWGAHLAHAALTQQLGLGARGAEVTQLQSFLSLSHDIYPSAITSGYYGKLTQNAVSEFQSYFDLPVVGRVGPMTLTKINAVMASGKGLDVSAPILSGVTVAQTNNSATVSWMTNENSSSSVFYSSTPLVIAEATMNFTAPAISGSSAGSDSIMGTTHSVSLSGLSPNTSYYYSVRSIDASGNVSMSWPVLFRTNS